MKVFYNEKQMTEHNISISPSAEKPVWVVKDWTEKGYPVTIISDFSPVTREDFYRAHEQSYVDDVLDLKIDNGFRNRIPEVNETLIWTTGSLVAASHEAVNSKENTCSPTSGFHHAGWAGYMPKSYFCTFNGLIVAAQSLIKRNDVQKVGILDLDHHVGNGTVDILRELDLDFIHHYSFGEEYNYITSVPSNYDWKGGVFAEKWISTLPEALKKFSGCDVVIYQAGADPHVDDPYGGALTDAQLRERDKIVFSEFKKMNIPVAWNLAGGYQYEIERVLRIHRATLEECLAAS